MWSSDFSLQFLKKAFSCRNFTLGQNDWVISVSLQTVRGITGIDRPSFCGNRVVPDDPMPFPLCGDRCGSSVWRGGRVRVFGCYWPGAASGLYDAGGSGFPVFVQKEIVEWRAIVVAPDIFPWILCPSLDSFRSIRCYRLVEGIPEQRIVVCRYTSGVRQLNL